MMLNQRYHTLRLILGDQLNLNHSWFSERDDGVLYLIAELRQETDYVKHHVQKICAFFLAMQDMAQQLQADGHHVLHMDLDDTAAFSMLPQLLKHVAERFSIASFHYQQPDEYRLLHQLRSLNFSRPIQMTEYQSEHFYLPFDELSRYVKPAQHNRLESFYRKLRVRFDILMDGDQPAGGQWNYDAENRAKLKPKDLRAIPQPLLFGNAVENVITRIKRHTISYFGDIEATLLWPINREQSLTLLQYFCDYCLPLFGRFQDAMTCEHPNKWSLYHSRLSFALNTKLLNPAEVIETAVSAYESSNGAVTLAQIEGFVRQILGWREYVRAVYWMNMPHYAEQNALNAQRDLPPYFWDAATKMKCVKEAVSQSLEFAYAHHIQRLMVTGNFCLLTGVDPAQVDEWYLGIYIDAIEWVEMPNTRGMSQFADGGYVATKPYCAGGNYINKMSDYCKSCDYKIKEKSTEDACPFNSLYWAFMHKHREKFGQNPRIGMIYRNWDKQAPEQKQATLDRAKWCLENIDRL